MKNTKHKKSSEELNKILAQKMEHFSDPTIDEEEREKTIREIERLYELEQKDEVNDRENENRKFSVILKCAEVGIGIIGAGLSIWELASRGRLLERVLNFETRDSITSLAGRQVVGGVLGGFKRK